MRAEPTTKSEVGMSSLYQGWSRQRRFKAAAERVIHEKWTIVEAAKQYGVSRPRLSEHVKQLREKLADAKGRSNDSLSGKAGAPAIGINERRRVPTGIEFDQLYFGHVVCPDCGVHHERPGFHDELITADESSDRRVIANVFPYGAKSTIVTVRGTLRELAKDPNSRHIIVSKSQTFAATQVSSIKEWLSNPELYVGAARNLIEDFGPFQAGASQWNTNQVYIAGRVTGEKDPSVLALGVGNQIYGRRADRIVFDDIATLENQRNPQTVADQLEWIDKEALTRIGRNGKARWVGTRVHHGDVYSTLRTRDGYNVIAYPVIMDEIEELTLWPEHLPWEYVQTIRNEMKPADFQLVYMQEDMPGAGAAFLPEDFDACRDFERVVGQYDSRWKLVGGLDPGGGGSRSGNTAFVLTGIDLYTGRHYLIDLENHKAMKAPQMRDKLFEWTERYNIAEWRVESNAMNAQVVQYDDEVRQFLGARGCRLVGHYTSSTGRTGKWDPQFGVESCSPLFTGRMISIPWGDQISREKMSLFRDQLIHFPMNTVFDTVMGFWFSVLGCRDTLRRSALPMTNARQHVPSWVKKRRKVVSFATQSVRPLPSRNESIYDRAVAERQQRGARGLIGTTPVEPEPEVFEDRTPHNVPEGIWVPAA